MQEQCRSEARAVQGRSSTGVGQEQGRSRVGAGREKGQENSVSRVGAEQEQGRSRMMKAARLGWAGAEQGKSRPGAVQRYARSRVGAVQDQSGNWLKNSKMKDFAIGQFWSVGLVSKKIAAAILNF